MLIDSKQLREILKEDPIDNLKIFDCRFNLMDPEAGRANYLQGHIPNSQYVDLNKDLAGDVTSSSGRHPLPSKEDWTKTLQDWGINEDSVCILYDDVAGAMAARLWWMLSKWNGLKNVSLLDGGIQGWKDIGEQLEKDVYAIRTSTFEPEFNDDQVVDSHEVVEGLKDKSIQLIDARAKPRFEGKEETIDAKAGHVPGAENYEFTENLESGMLKSSEELTMQFSPLTDLEKPIVSMCGSGVTGCHNIFSLAKIGVDAKLYVGSWSEWIKDDSREVETE